MKKTTESDSLYDHLESMEVGSILENINREDAKVSAAVHAVLPALETFIQDCFLRMKSGGRLFYLGAGTSGRLGIVDASECPPTFGVPHGLVIGIIAGGDAAIRKAVEFAEDDITQGWIDLEKHGITAKDTLIGIAASGTTPYVLGAIKKAKDFGVLTAGITCNPGAPLALEAAHALVVEVGPEFVTGSTRMKSGTAQKLILNMISTTLMIKLGHVKGNKMVDMQLSNDKLIDRAIRMLQHEVSVSEEEAKQLLNDHGSVRKAVTFFLTTQR
jgi:N-acetylmuramic acid 6-phosphate etherase